MEDLDLKKVDSEHFEDVTGDLKDQLAAFRLQVTACEGKTEEIGASTLEAVGECKKSVRKAQRHCENAKAHDASAGACVEIGVDLFGKGFAQGLASNDKAEAKGRGKGAPSSPPRTPLATRSTNKGL